MEIKLRYKETGEIHVFNYPVDARQAFETGRFETINGESPIQVVKQAPKQEESDEQAEKVVPRIRRKRQVEESTEVNEVA